MDIQKMFLEADALEPECIRIRRDFHKYPEMAWTEFRTTAAEAYGCEAEIAVKGYCPTGDGTIDFAKKIVEWTSIVPDLKGRKEVQPNTGGTDDFAYMMRYIQEQGKPACYMNLFTKLSAGLHNSAYDMDECCLKAGVKSCLAVLNGYLAEH